jgi:hypothetical protein
MFYLRHAVILLLSIMIGGLLNTASAQSPDFSIDTKPPRGFMPNSEQLSSPVDNIDTVNGKLHIQIPLGSLPRGRGGMGFDWNIHYDSNLYDMTPDLISYPQGQPPQDVRIPVKNLTGPNLDGGWSYGTFYYLDLETKEGIDLANGSC